MPELEQVRIVARSQISDLASEAETAPRRRTHLLLHSGPQDQVQRLMIVLQPGSYIRPHHHSEQWELVVLLQGRGDLLRFDGSGCLADRIELSRSAPGRADPGRRVAWIRRSREGYRSIGDQTRALPAE